MIVRWYDIQQWGRGNWWALTQRNAAMNKVTPIRPNNEAPKPPADWSPPKVDVRDGEQRCPRGACSECDGFHHWYSVCLNLEDLSRLDDEEREAYAAQIKAGIEVFYTCKHCTAWTPDDIESMDDE